MFSFLLTVFLWYEIASFLLLLCVTCVSLFLDMYCFLSFFCIFYIGIHFVHRLKNSICFCRLFCGSSTQRDYWIFKKNFLTRLNFILMTSGLIWKHFGTFRRGIVTQYKFMKNSFHVCGFIASFFWWRALALFSENLAFRPDIISFLVC